MRRTLIVGAAVWAVTGFAVAMVALRTVNDDARGAVAFASIAFPACAALAAWMIARRRDRAGGWLLVVSVATPTYFAWVLGIPALVAGVLLIARAHRMRPVATH